MGWRWVEGVRGEARAPRGQGGTHGAGKRSGRPKARENVGGGAKGHGNGNEVGRRAVRKENEAGGDDRGGRGAKKKLWEQGRAAKEGAGGHGCTNAVCWSGWGGWGRRATGWPSTWAAGEGWVDDRAGR